MKNVAVNARATVPYSLIHPDTMGMDDRDCYGHCSVNGSNESVKFGFKIDFKILMDRISKFRPDHDMALVDIVYHCCFWSVRWRAREGVVKSRRKSLKIHTHTHRHTDQLNYIYRLAFNSSLKMIKNDTVSQPGSYN